MEQLGIELKAVGANWLLIADKRRSPLTATAADGNPHPRLPGSSRIELPEATSISRPIRCCRHEEHFRRDLLLAGLLDCGELQTEPPVKQNNVAACGAELLVHVAAREIAKVQTATAPFFILLAIVLMKCDSLF